MPRLPCEAGLGIRMSAALNAFDDEQAEAVELLLPQVDC